MKTLAVLVLFLLLVSTRVSSKDEEYLEGANVLATPPPPLLVKAHPPPPAPVKVTPPPPSTPAPPVKVTPPPPSTPAPPVKPPLLAPPVKPPPSAPQPTPPKNTKECYPPCVVRCKLHSRKNVCLRACVTCCDRCKCVPPGQYGNREKCGKCYVNMTTRGGRPKCP